MLKHAPPAADQQLKVVEAGPYNVGVGIIHRGPTKDSTDGTSPCIIHHNQTQTYMIVSGGGTLVTGRHDHECEREIHIAGRKNAARVRADAYQAPTP